jgi:acyl-coenzyme A thioesterase PaaI-like protein
MTAPAQADLAYFQKIPWCAQLLLTPDIIITPVNSREYKESTEDALFSKTFNKPDTIERCLSFYKRPEADRIDDIYMLLSLGYRLNGHPGIAHGGVLATIIDEGMGILVGINKRLGLVAGKGNTMTAYLNVTYVKPVATPQTVLVSARLKEVKGQKHFLEATIKNGKGELLSKAEALFVVIKARI